MINLLHLNNESNIEISSLVNQIKKSFPDKYKVMSPLWHFQWLAKDNMQFYCNKSESEKYITYWFDLYETNIDNDFVKSVKSLYKFNKQYIYKCKLRKVYIALNINKENNNYSLVLSTIYKDLISISDLDKKDFPAFSSTSTLKFGINYHLYENQEIWNYKTKTVMKYKCTMKDLFYFQKDSLERKLLLELFELWSSEYKIWKDLLRDFKQGTAYSAIPLRTIFNSHNRKELIELRYGKECSFNRNNRETIGKGIFLARAKRVIEPEDFTLIMNIPEVYLENEFIGREKSDTLYPITYFLIDRYPWILKYFHDKYRLNEFLFDSVQHNIKIRLNFTESSFNKWTLETTIKIKTHKNRLHFNKEYPINNLKIEEFEVVKTTKMFNQECIKQNVDLTDYIHNINEGTLAVYTYHHKRNDYLLIINIYFRKKKGKFSIYKAYKNKKILDVESTEYKSIKKIIQNINKS